uniref:F5/8 type C domain-containing protein n=1 Tax=Vespula pensylvanica TaxID=30213 RepID=A0A834U3Z7_VESPE|nr:hypothetical protein H0235_012166 [Vespula pensylvanica]
MPVRKPKLSWSLADVSFLSLCLQVIPGNTNTYLESKHELEPPLWASKIRFLPFSRHTRTVCMRVELYGCYWSDGVVSYSMPQGDKRGNEWEFFDATYDGHWDDELRRGLGQLTDGKTGPDDFKMGYYDDRGQGWVGWRNDTRSDQPIEIKFEFDVVREFSAIHIYCNNQFTRDVQQCCSFSPRKECEDSVDQQAYPRLLNVARNGKPRLLIKTESFSANGSCRFKNSSCRDCCREGAEGRKWKMHYMDASELG